MRQLPKGTEIRKDAMANKRNSPEPSTPHRFVSIGTAADYIEVAPRTIQRYLKQGRLTRYRVNKRVVRVDLNELDRLLESDALGQDE